MDIRKISQKQEKRTAKQFKGKVTPGSGCIDNFKGDVRTDDFLIENKFTCSRFNFKKSIWDKIHKEALKDNLKEPLLQLDFVKTYNDFYSFIIMDYYFFLENFDERIYFEFKELIAHKTIALDLSDIEAYNKRIPFRWDILFDAKTRVTMLKLDDFWDVLNKGCN